MLKDTRVLILEDDPYAREMMAMLLARDWRTRLAGESSQRGDIEPLLQQTGTPIDVVLLDLENPYDPSRPLILAEQIANRERPPVILFLATHAHLRTIERCLPFRFGGYLLKHEILYSLASAVALASQGWSVLTPGVMEVAGELPLPERVKVISGEAIQDVLSPRLSEILRLSLLFNLSQRDIADELVLSPAWVAEAVSSAYEKLGVQDVLNEHIHIEDLFEDPRLQERGRSILERPGQRGLSRKAPWMATLAFHLLTRPRIS